MELPAELDICGVTYVRADRIPERTRGTAIERHYLVSELVKMSGFSKSTLERAIQNGELTAVCPNGGVRYRRIPESSYLRWLASKSSRS